MSADLKSRFKSVAEDLEHLGTDWLNIPRDDAVRRGSVILRRLLAEGVLQRAWKEYEFSREPTIVAPDLRLIVGNDFAKVRVALAGGAIDGGIEIAGAISYTGRPSEAIGPPIGLERPFKLSEFMESASVIIDGHVIKRREVVKYFAHFEGGVHLLLSSRIRKEEEQLVRSVSRWRRDIELCQRDGLYFELLSIGQAIGRADDMKKLSGAIRAYTG